MAKKSGHPLGVTGRMLFGAAITSVGMGLSAGVAAADPQTTDTQSTQDSRPAPAVDVRTMTDQELSAELGRVAGKDTLRQQEVVTEMKARGAQFWEAAPAPNGLGVSAGVPVRPGVSVTGTIAYDPYTGSWIVSGGVRAGTPSGPKFTGITPKPDGLNANGNVKVDLGEYGEFTSSVDLNVAPDGSVTGSYTAKGTVTTPDGHSYETEVKVSRNADGSLDVQLPDGYTTSTPVPGGGTIESETPADPLKERKEPEIKLPGPKTEEQKQPQKKTGGWSDWFDWFDLSGSLSIDKQIRPAPMPTPTPEELEAAKKSWAEQQRTAREQQDAWRAQNRQESQYREAQERAQQRADAAAAAERAAMPDRDHDGIPDAEDRTWNQNDTDPSSADVGDGPEGGKGYPSDRVDNPAPANPPTSDDPDADHDRDGVPDRNDATWNQNDTDPSSSDIGDGPEGGEGYGSPDVDGDGRTGSADATPNQNDTDPSSTDIGDGPEGGEGYGGNDSGDSGSFSGSLSDSGNDSGNDSGRDSGNESGRDSDSSGHDSGSDSGSMSGSLSDSGADSGSSADSGSYSGGYSDSGADNGGYSGSSTSDSNDADGDGLSGAADSTPNQNDTDPSSTDVGDGPEGNSGYSGSTDSGYGGDPGTGDCACV